MLFPEMTVYENLEMGAYLLRDRTEFSRRLETVQQMFPILKERSGQMVALMSGGEQQMLAIGRALMGQPDLILLDEPSTGLAPKIFDQILSTVIEINRERKTTIVIAEQNVRKILKIVDFAYVLEAGKVAISGTPEVLSSDESIRRAYLGL
jgi:branched-chain amino acid transport system ATP-binding protein